MGSALADVPWEPCCLEPRHDRELERYARERLGVPNLMVRYVAAVPWVARAATDLHPELGLLTQLDERTAALIGLVVSQENACRFCYAAVRMLLWFQGMDPERIRHLEQDLARPDAPPMVRAAIEYARSQSRTGPTGARRAWAALRSAGASAAAAREVAFTVAVTDFLNRVSTAPAVPAVPIERIPDFWPMRLLRPLLGRRVRDHRARGEATAAPAVSPDLPYGSLVGAFAGSPIAPVLARTLEELWASPVLSRRAKLLMFAVVSRGLPCDLCELEATRALQREGCAPAEVAQLVAHLDGPAAQPIERDLMRFSRETLWYEPARLQRHTRALRERLSNEQLVEAIAVAAFANGICRMAAVVMNES